MRFTTLSNYFLIDQWCNFGFCLFAWIDFRFCYSHMTSETGGLELASTIILVLQANRLTKCASHPELVNVNVYIKIKAFKNIIMQIFSFFKLSKVFWSPRESWPQWSNSKFRTHLSFPHDLPIDLSGRRWDLLVQLQLVSSNQLAPNLLHFIYSTLLQNYFRWLLISVAAYGDIFKLLWSLPKSSILVPYRSALLYHWHKTTTDTKFYFLKFHVNTIFT